ncbi:MULTISPECIES: NmrA/HSCARG family protein [Streptomyces]|uniref:NmrA/HSCARG family protein n=1 Tax=Streptomyces griseoaurantiacus TaxID=68213 RepID=A0ABZ1UYK6_9ACTN|nr:MULTISPECIES: NmrA/HSCARG family protein [Streptomyces]MCF0088985.1 NAD(P)H azoreductase [Streptomyces sp. MH192]MCF0101474.1 NAD(P)H azoreductase [Streptomyces sp. MH191]MDX3090080.1 NmrA/HSCARG family protein [Streptomyces sp. ME12-02E]MDX3333366.1 NmrA/HSCARG family protein [Streptomyces sp. ME02-6978a]WTI29028.1 NmrA/HSCARG family protein [Streptomyces jietaisiensis]
MSPQIELNDATPASSSPHRPGTIAVFGATGRQGGAVVDALLDHKARVRALVRDPHSDRARALAARGVELAAVRTDDPATLVAALTAVEAFSFMTPEANSLEEVETEIRIGTALVDAAVEAGVPHVLFNSVLGADRERGVPHHDSKHTIEEYLGKSGLRAEVVRPAPFMEEMAPKLEHGEIVVRLPMPEDAPLKMISVRDLGRVAAALLLGLAEAPGGAVELVGDELTGPRIAAAFGARAGLPARYEALPLSVLPTELDRVMFREFAEAGEHPSDLGAVRAIEPDTLDLAEWIRVTGWTAPTHVAGS